MFTLILAMQLCVWGNDTDIYQSLGYYLERMTREMPDHI